MNVEDVGDFPHQLEDEKRLIRGLKRKDPNAWGQLYANYKPCLRIAIRKSLAKYNLPNDRLDDVEQKTWHTVVRRIDEFEPRHDHAIRNWLGSIQHHHVQNMARKRTAIPLEELGTDTDEDWQEHLNQGSEPSPESEMISRETQREIWSAIDLVLQNLPAHHREIVLGRLVLKESVDELAQRYSLKPQTIYQITTNAKKKLRSYLLAPDLFLRVQSDKAGGEKKSWKK